MGPAVPDWLVELGKYVSGGIGSVVGLRFLDAWFNRRKDNATARKTDAEADKTLGDIVDDQLRILIDGLKEQISWLRGDITRLEKQVADQADHIKRQDERIVQQANEIIVLRKALDAKANRNEAGQTS